MPEVLVLAEHRMGVLREVTLEMLSKGLELAEESGSDLVAVILGHEIEDQISVLKKRADRVLALDRKDFRDFNAEAYQQVLSRYIRQNKPLLILVGHTSFGVDLAPSLAVEVGSPCVTDCIDLSLREGGLRATRQMYGGKVNAEISLRESETYIVTVRPATFEAMKPRFKEGEVTNLDALEKDTAINKKFVEYVTPPTGEVDISTADIIVSFGRGIRDEKNIDQVEKLAKELRGEIGCSRPIVDKGWLPKERQVGSSGKTVKPKLYIATGISGAFQHVMGMKNSELIIAINKDSKAPIFHIADIGIVDDLNRVIPAITKKITESRQ